MAFRSNAELDSYVMRDIHDGFNRDETAVFLSTGYKVTPSLELSLSLGYADRSYTQLDSFTTPEDYHATSIGDESLTITPITSSSTMMGLRGQSPGLAKFTGPTGRKSCHRQRFLSSGTLPCFHYTHSSSACMAAYSLMKAIAGMWLCTAELRDTGE